MFKNMLIVPEYSQKNLLFFFFPSQNLVIWEEEKNLKNKIKIKKIFISKKWYNCVQVVKVLRYRNSYHVWMYENRNKI